MSEPLISVVMPVHNGLPFLQEAVQSILNQTFKDFEFVILNDNSTDQSLDLLREWERKDQRIRVHSSAQRLGLVASSNEVIRKSRAQLIARMDADDLCEPDRLERQWAVLRDHPSIAAVGTLCDGVNARGKRVRPRDRWRIARKSTFLPFPHGSVMMRRSVFERVGGYALGSEGSEDQDLFRRIATHGSVVTLPDVLYHYRYHLKSSTTSGETNANRVKTVESCYTLGAMRLWAGHHAAILDDMRNDKSTSRRKKFMMQSWALWADLHPASLRSTARMIIRTRDLVAGIRVRDGRTYEWRFE